MGCDGESNDSDKLAKTALTILPFSNQFHVELIRFYETVDLVPKPCVNIQPAME